MEFNRNLALVSFLAAPRTEKKLVAMLPSCLSYLSSCAGLMTSGLQLLAKSTTTAELQVPLPGVHTSPSKSASLTSQTKWAYFSQEPVLMMLDDSVVSYRGLPWIHGGSNLVSARTAQQ
ncbi:uncharacterized protein ARMOST_06456 [Armillaria ostoyae]|uniref:Uncharacterized protein n=1 Tax=Armillaria ostoyae TaxID=47428 RepID=A0A284R306_ARMOS|nr:uncharacterized protein ARMOST_06456 [Armillaria ostoyae]